MLTLWCWGLDNAHIMVLGIRQCSHYGAGIRQCSHYDAGD